jgi:hypothetical protein
LPSDHIGPARVGHIDRCAERQVELNRISHFNVGCSDRDESSIATIDVSTRIGLRGRAVLAVLIDTAARVRAVAKLTLKSVKHDGSQYTLRVSEKGGKSREIRVRHDLEQALLAYVEVAAISEGPLFRTALPAGHVRARESDPLPSA